MFLIGVKSGVLAGDLFLTDTGPKARSWSVYVSSF